MVALKISAVEICQMTIQTTSVRLGILKVMMRKTKMRRRAWASRYHHCSDLTYQFQEKLLSWDHKLIINDENFINNDYKNLINEDSEIIKPETRKRRKHHHWLSRTMLMQKVWLDNKKDS